MICTERYVDKADGALGGVGYEKMIVTSELIRNLGTAKFVPVVRQNGPERRLPRFLGAHYYIDLSEGADIAEEQQKLLRELHSVPPDKPGLGHSPFISGPLGPQTATTFDDSDPLAVYRHAIALARAGDMLAWRSILSLCRNRLGPELSKWQAKYLTQMPTLEQLVGQSMEGIEIYAPLMAVGLGGVASTAPRYKDQSSVLDEILHPPNWQRSGYVVRTELPMSPAFYFSGSARLTVLLH